LLRVCGELRLNVPGDSAGHISEVVGSDFCIERSESHFSDLSFLYSGIQCDQWLALHKIVLGKSDWKLRFVWVNFFAVPNLSISLTSFFIHIFIHIINQLNSI